MENKVTQMTSEEFKATREMLKLTQGQLAYKIGLSERAIRYYEQGGRSVPAPVSMLLETFLRGVGRA
jgi:DNA-binding transcriptional regulator YiaG